MLDHSEYMDASDRRNNLFRHSASSSWAAQIELPQRITLRCRCSNYFLFWRYRLLLFFNLVSAAFALMGHMRSC